jgi:hypothetical protein
LNTNYKGDKLLNTLKNTKEINQIWIQQLKQQQML